VVGEQGGGAIPIDGTEIDDDPFRRWAGVLLAALALLALLAGVLAAWIAPVPFGFGLLGIAALQAALVAFAWVGLRDDRRWGRPAAFAILGATAAIGIGGAILDFTRGVITIPIFALLALVVLRMAGPMAMPVGTSRRTLVVLLASLVAAQGLPAAIAWAISSPASPLTATADDMVLTVVATCHGATDAMPDRVDATVSWHWLRGEAVVTGPDGVGLAWSPDLVEVVEGDFDLYASATSDEAYVASGSAELAGAAVDEALAGRRNWTWSVDAEGGGLRDGWASVTLVAQPGTRPAHGVLSIEGVYAHNDRWLASGDDACDW